MKLRWQVKLSLILFCAFIIAGCGRPKPVAAVKSPAKKKAKPVQGKVTLKSGQIHLSDQNGKRIWEAEAARIEGDFASGSGTLYQVTCSILENERLALSASADTASYLPKRRTVLLQGNVKAAWPARKARLQTDKVLWSLDKKHIDASGHVVLERADERLEGNSLSTDLGLKQIDIQ